MENEILADVFELESIIYENKNYIFYKAVSTEDNAPVILKTVASTAPSAMDIAYITTEYELLKSLDLEGVPRVVELKYHDLRPILVLEGFGDVTLSQFIADQKIGIKSFLIIAIEISTVVGLIHEKNITHKNINPDNILINRGDNKIKIIDLGLATKLGRERQFAQNINVLEGTLEYMSPEQTGRMNRSIDYRTDLYSLGFCFYYMLTGSAPFYSEDTMEMIHFHIAKNIDTIPLKNLDIPPMLIAIIQKLSSKIAEDRYQSIRGLKFDLEQCLEYVRKNVPITDFKLASNDLSLDFRIPEHLYGREDEMKHLLATYDQVASGENHLMLIDGSSGIGKTAMVNEIHKQNVRKKGFFIAGKFDQFKSNIPFYAFSMAFSDLLKQLLSEPSDKIQHYKSTLKKALGTNVAVLIDLLPSFEIVLGKQHAIPDLNPLEAQNRFFFTLRDFIRVFATKEHPLIIFLDDLQWCDDSSLLFLKDLINQKVPYVFIIGTYRSNETPVGHPLLMTIDALKSTSAIHEITLKPLKEEHVNKILCDTLYATEEQVKDLGNIIFKRTAGNPFYIVEFLKTIYFNGFINIDHNKGQWTYDLPKISALKISDNVVDILSKRLKELPAECQKVIELAACMGNTFDLKSLSSILSKSPVGLSDILWTAIVAEVIIPLSEKYRFVSGNEDFGVAYKFQHDKIHQAAYQNIDEETKKQLHYKIGQYLIQTNLSENAEENIIEVVTHLNEAKSLIQTEAEALNLAVLNDKAGHKAQAAVAYQAAMQYYKNGLDLLPQNSWSNYYRLTFDLYYGLAQNAYQIGEIDTAEQCIETLFLNVKNKMDNVKILSLRLRQYTTLGKTEQAIQQGIKGLALLGLKLPEYPGPLVVLKEVLEAKWNLRGKNPEDLLEQPIMSDPEKTAAARLLTEIGPSAYILGNDNLYALTALKLVNLSLKYGNCPESSFAYITFGAVLGEAFGDYKMADRFGKLAINLNYKLNNIEYRCRVIAAYGVLIHHFSLHLKELNDWYKKGIEAGYQSGDLFFLGFCAANCTFWNPTLDLATSYQEQKKYLKIVQDTRYDDALYSAFLLLQTTQNLRGLTNSHFSLDDDSFNEKEFLQNMVKRKYLSGIGMYYITKAYLHMFYEDFDTALYYIDEADKYKKSLVSHIFIDRLCTISFFTYSALLSKTHGYKKLKLRYKMNAAYKKMQKWANYNEVNFLHLQLLMKAEIESHNNNFAKATILYEQGIEYAQKNEWKADAAFGTELLAKHFLRNNVGLAATEYMAQSIALYKDWGAKRKKKFLKEKYAKILNHKTLNSLGNNILDSKDSPQNEGKFDMDMASIIKTSQAISGEIMIESLLSKMIQIIVMNAGAENAILLLENDNKLYIQATSYNNVVNIMPNIALKNYENIAQSIVNYVSQLKESIVLNDASVEGKFINDPYIIKTQTKSVLCSPIILLNKLYGIIYLENNILTNAFTEDRLKVLNLLSTQMAISIQNALIYANLEEKVALRTSELSKSLHQLKATQNQLIQSEKMASLGELTAGIAHEIQNPLNFVINFSELSLGIAQELKVEMEKFQIPEKDKAYINEILTDLYDNQEKVNHHGKRASSIVKGMLEHSRKNTGIKERTDVNHLVKEALSLSFHGLKSKDMAFDAEFKMDLDDKIHKINIISQDIGRVLLNIFNNAFYIVNQRAHLSKSAGESYTPSVFVSTKQLEDTIEIRIKDNGTGMSERVRAKIFQPFFTTKPTGQGTGLGLSLAYDIVTKGHGGTLEVLSTEGVGSEFVITLPLKTNG